MFKRIMTTAAVVAALIGASPAVAATMWGLNQAGDTLTSYASLGDWVTNTASGVHLNPAGAHSVTSRSTVPLASSTALITGRR